jgi:hypothetical protein
VGKIVVLDASASAPVEKPTLSKDVRPRPPTLCAFVLNVVVFQLLWYGHEVDSAGDPWSFQHRLVGHAAVSAQVALPSDDANLTWRLNANVTDMDPDAKAVLVGGSNDNRTRENATTFGPAPAPLHSDAFLLLLANSGQVIFFEKCLLATGSSPHRLREYVGGRLVNANDDLPFEPNSPYACVYVFVTKLITHQVFLHCVMHQTICVFAA